MRSRAWPRGCRAAAWSSRPRTARPPPRRWSRRSSARRHPARAQPRRSEHGGRRGRGAGRGVGPRRRHGPVRGRRVLARARWRPSSQPRAVLLGNLFRDQLDRYGELEMIADRWAEIVAGLRRRRPRSCSTPTTRWSPISGATAEATYFGVEDDALALPEMQHASDSKHCRRCGAAYVYEAVYLAHLGLYACPSCGARRPDPAVRAARRRAARHPLGRVHALHGGRRAADRAAAAGPLQRLQRARRGRAVPGARRPARRRRRRPGRVAPAFGRAETIELAGRPTSVLLVKNPAGANEVLRTLALEGTQLDLLGVLNDRIADGRDVSWVWDADWELVAPHVRRLTCSGTRAAELALRLKYAGVAPERLEVVERPRHGARPRAGSRRGPAVRAADLHRAARAPGPARPARPRRGVLEVSDRVVWHELECGGYVADLPLWRELARARRPGARRRRRHRPGDARPARAGHAVTALDLDPELLAELAERGGRAADPDAARGRRRLRAGEPRSRSCAVPMQTIQLLADAEPAPASWRAPAARSPRRARRARDRRRARAVRGPEFALPCPTRRRGRWLALPRPSRPPCASVNGGTRIERLRQTIAPSGERSTAEDVDRADRVCAATLQREGAAAGLEPLLAPLHRADATTTSAPRWCCCVAEPDAARVRALSRPDEHLRRPRQPAAARAPLRVARASASSCSGSGSATRSTRTRRPVLHRRRPGPRPGAVRARHGRDQARRAARGRRPRRRGVRRVRRLSAARPRLRAWVARRCRASAWSTSRRCVRTGRG